MKIYYREKSGGIEILRCFGIEGRVEIPGMIDDKLVISAAPYAFSSHMHSQLLQCMAACKCTTTYLHQAVRKLQLFQIPAAIKNISSNLF